MPRGPKSTSRVTIRTKGVVRFALALALIAAAAAGFGPSARSEPCPGTNIEIDAQTRSDFLDACAGAATARAFLGARGLVVDDPLDIRLVRRLSEQTALHAYGCFDRRTGRVMILTFDACGDLGSDRKVLGLPLDRRLYRSIVVHEVAHAIAAANFATGTPTLLAQEYIAYVTQIGSLPNDLRVRVLARHDVQAFAGEGEIGTTYLLLAPDAFAVKVYLHFVAQEDGDTFIRGVLAGRHLRYDGY